MFFKKPFLFLLFCFALHNIFAFDLDKITDEVFKNSTDYKNGKINLQKERADYNKLLFNNKHSLSFGVNNFEYEFDTKKNVQLTPFFEYSSNTDDNFSLKVNVPLYPETTYTTLAGNSSQNDSEKTYYLEPKIEIGKSFDLSGVKSLEKSLLEKKSYIARLKDEERYDLTYKKLIYESIINCITSYQSVEKQVLALEKLKKNYDADMALKSMEEGSLDYSDKTSQILASQVLLKTAQDSFENAKNNFKITAGFDFPDIDDDFLCSFSFDKESILYDFEVKKEGNADCLIKKYDYLIAKNKYDKVKNGNNKITSNLRTEYKKNIENNNDYKGDLDINGSIELKQPLFDITLEGGAEKILSDEPKPSVGFSIKISPDKSYKIDKIETEAKALDVEIARIEYSQEIYEYYAKAINAQSKLLSSKSTLKSAEANLEYAHLLYENSKKLSQLGYKSDIEEKDDKQDFRDANIEYIKKVISLLCDIIDAKILNI